MNPLKRKTAGFTLVELLIAVSIFAVVSMIVATLYVQAFRESRRANLQNQIFEDARFIMSRIADEIRSGMIDYDEYYNQNVVIPGAASIAGAASERNYGQNYGRYYSSFYNPGSDDALGFDCNTVELPADGAVGTPARTLKRNQRTCVPLRATVDRNTGANPFSGKYLNAEDYKENAFCGNVSYAGNAGAARGSANYGECGGDELPDSLAAREQDELYLISSDGRKRTILARERIGGTDAAPIFALSLLRLDGMDSNDDGIADKFICAPQFLCRGTQSVTGSPARIADADCGAPETITGELPRNNREDLGLETGSCDTEDTAFSKDFIPISPLRINIKNLKFYISPSENPHYAFAETAEQKQPLVTIVLTLEPNPENIGVREDFSPVTIVRNVSPRTLEPIPAPLLIGN